MQIYMDVPEGLPDPVVVRVGHNALENTAQIGTPDPNVIPHDIEWERREDPEESGEDNIELVASKLWGKCYFDDIFGSDERLLLFLDEQPAGFNFGGDELMLAINDAEAIRWVSA